MPIEILMPALSPTMTEGTLAKWLVKEGDEVASGDVVAEIETDKATMEVEAVDEGKVGKLLVDEGTEGVAVNTPIALLLEEDEDASALEGAGKTAPAAPTAAPEPTAQPAPAAGNGAAAPATAAASAPRSNGSEGRIFASPLARRMAKQAGIPLERLSGSGPHGRIVKVDVEAAIASGVPAEEAKPEAAAPAKPPPAAPTAVAQGVDAKAFADQLDMAYRLEPLSTMRKTIAKRLTQSSQTVPHFYLTIDCELDALLAQRKALNAKVAERDIKISVNDFVIRGAALALKEVPAANASYADEGLLYYEHADVSVAVATPSGLITPIVKAAETKGLATISSEMKVLAGRARKGKLEPKDYQGGTFSISNLGMFGISHFGAIINPPQGAILAVGQGEQKPVVKDGALAVATVMSCTLSVDHRVVDGAVGAEFLAAFKRLIEDPQLMLL